MERRRRVAIQHPFKADDSSALHRISDPHLGLVRKLVFQGLGYGLMLERKRNRWS